ncbi:MAG: hypothetical protein ABR551_11885 [Gemmatimonadales bacterium]
MAGLSRAAALIILTTTLFATVVEAQYEPGRKFLGPRIGLSGVGGAPAFGAQFEVAREDRIGIGALVDYWSYNSGAGFGSVGVSYLALGATGSYHFEVEDTRWDPFVGLALGYFVVSWDDQFAGAAASRLFLGGQGGVRYFFKETTAFVARAGFGASYISVGIDFGF